MPPRLTAKNRSALIRKINRKLGALTEFTVTHPATQKNPWSDAEFKEYRRLYDGWFEAVQELNDFEHQVFLPKTT